MPDVADLDASVVDVTTSDSSSDSPFDVTADSTSNDASLPDALADVVVVGPDADTVAAPRPIAPLSASTATRQRPTLHWELVAQVEGAFVEVYLDRACTTLVTSFRAMGTHGAPPQPLQPGVYFWRLHGISNSVVGIPTSVVWELVVGARSAPVDTSWGSMVDFNGDGRADAVIGAPDLDSLIGAVLAYEGDPSGLSSPPVTLTGGAPPFPEFGTAVASADVNGDGFADIVIGSPSQNGGAAFVYAGGPGGLGTLLDTILGPASQHDFGGTVTAAGDVNGDGYGDVLVEGPSGGAPAGIGLYLGSPTGLSGSPLTVSTSALSSVDGIGDINGDGFGDFAIGDFWGGNDNGIVTVYLGGAGGPTAAPPLAGPIKWAGFGYATTGADVNGDGYADLVAGLCGETQAVAVYFGSGAGLPSTPSVLLDPMIPNGSLGYPSDEFGSDLSSADVNGDGFADILVGDPGYGGSPGAVYLYLGGPDGPSMTPMFLQLAGVAGFGHSVSGPGDVNGDGFADVLIGAPFTNGSTGTAYLYLGGAGGLASSPTQSLQGPGSRGAFGSSIAGTSQE